MSGIGSDAVHDLDQLGPHRCGRRRHGARSQWPASLARQAELEAARIVDGRMVLESAGAFDRALDDGVFYLEIQDDLGVAAGDDFFRQTCPDTAPRTGLAQRRRDQLPPPEVAALRRRLDEVSAQILRSVLEYVGLPEASWSDAVAGLGARSRLDVNYCRAWSGELGPIPHKDDGFLTILRTLCPDLEINRSGGWLVVPADPRFFVVTFGIPIEELTANSGRPVSAALHRVGHEHGTCCSFGHFSSRDPGRRIGGDGR